MNFTQNTDLTKKKSNIIYIYIYIYIYTYKKEKLLIKKNIKPFETIYKNGEKNNYKIWCYIEILKSKTKNFTNINNLFQ